MKNLLLLIGVFFSFGFNPQEVPAGREDNFQKGEFLKFRVHHSLIPFNAGFATLRVDEEKLNGKTHYHVVGEGRTSGAARAFYKVDDVYESYINQETKKPTKFVRQVDEGGYIKDKVLTFDHSSKKVQVNDKKNKKVSFHRFSEDVQDMISAFYYLRNYDTSKLKNGDAIRINIFLDEEVFNFKLLILAREYKRTKFGKIKCLKIRPYVKSGRIFKESESVTMWVTDDKNHIPVEVKAELAIGSLKADLHEYKGVKYPLSFK